MMFLVKKKSDAFVTHVDITVDAGTVETYTRLSKLKSPKSTQTDDDTDSSPSLLTIYTMWVALRSCFTLKIYLWYMFQPDYHM